MITRVSVIGFLLLLPCVSSGQEGSKFDRDKDLAGKNPYTSAEDLKLGRQYFLGHCGQCHGPEGEGGRGANLTTGRLRHGSSDRELYMTLRRGIPGSEMPGSRLSQVELWRIVTYVRKLGSVGADERASGDASAGKIVFETKGGCAACHVVNGQGGLLGPDLSEIGFRRSLKFLQESLIDPSAHIAAGYRSAVVAPASGGSVQGVVLNEDDYSIQLRDMSGALRAFLKADLRDFKRDSKSLMPSYRSVLSEKELDDVVAYMNSLRGNPIASITSSAAGPAPFDRLLKADTEPANWLMYSGNYQAHRYSALDQIDTSNVHRLRLKWIYQMKTTHHVEVTPLVVDGIMYVTRPPSDVIALDAQTGRKFWEFNYPVPPDVHTCCGLVNRGLAILGDKLFLATIDAHILALDARSGRVLWKVKQADYEAGYSGTSAPLIVNNKVIAGIAGGENGIRGFVDAFDAATGKRAWRFYTTPGPGDPNFGSWEGDAWKTGGGGTWLTGSYDPALNLIYWGTGNPGPDWNDEHRAGDNLYTNSMLAIDADTGKLKWHFQYTPHDTHDWDSTQIPVLTDLTIRGRQRKVLILPNRNGFYYVLDRASGEFLLARQYVDKQTWANGIDDKGRPMLAGGDTPTEVGVLTSPGTDGGMSWYSPSLNRKTGLLYLASREKSMIYYKTQAVYRPGLSFSGGGSRDNPADPGYGLILALQPETGEILWRHKIITPMRSGVLSTAGNLVFGSTMEGNVFALDARTGKDLWHFPGNDVSYASPMSYACNGKQYVTVPIGDVLMAFGLE